MPVLYRKYRPKTFSEIIGQEYVVKTIINAIKTGKVSHAYLFYGPRGSGKTTIARLIAKSVNCTGRTTNSYEPCNKCISCVEINEGRNMDLIEIDAASNRGIDEIRSLKEGINVVPIKSNYKVYIIDEAHQLTKEASNAFLKTLEEPPAYAIFILCTTEYGKIISTIASRCQRFEFKKLNLPEIVKKLDFICKKENKKAAREALETIAKNSEGSIRDAESFLDKVISLSGKEIKKEDVEEILGIVEIESVVKLVNLIAKREEKEALLHINEVFLSGIDPEAFVGKLVSYLRDLLLFKVNPDIYERKNLFTKEEEENLNEQKKLFSEENIVEILKIFLDAQNRLRWSELPSLPVELAVIDTINNLK
jgi:DNA polymerase-3 subunit gamma/tau